MNPIAKEARPKSHEIRNAIEDLVEQAGWERWYAKNVVLARAQRGLHIVPQFVD